MNRVLLYKNEEIESSLYEIKDLERIEHIQNVLKSKPKDRLKLCLVDQSLAEGELLEISNKKVTIKILETYPGTKAPYHLLVGLSRPPTMKKVLEHGTTLGVSNFHFFKAELSEKSYLDSKIFQNDKPYELTHLGLAQSSIYFQSPKFQLSKYLPKDFSKYSQKYFLSLNGKQNFLKEELNFESPILLAIGPERGWTINEEETLLSLGFKPIKISASTLRVETAIFSALGQLELLRD